MSFYDEMAALAAEFTNGEMFTDAIVTSNGGSFDPITGTVVPAEPVVRNCRAVLSQTKVESDSGALVLSLTVTLDVEPNIDDLITISSINYRVVSAVRIAPIGTALLFKAVVTA